MSTARSDDREQDLTMLQCGKQGSCVCEEAERECGLMNSYWITRYMVLAEHVAQWSKDPSTRVGAVIVGRDRREIALGYNGPPPGIADDERLDVKETKYLITQHAERNVLDNARFDLRGATLITTLFPCVECAKSIISKRIARVITRPAPEREPWATSARWGRDLLYEADVEIIVLPIPF